MGYLLKRGYELLADFREDIDRHLQTPGYGGYEEMAKRTLGMYITFLRTGKEVNALVGEYYFIALYETLAAELEARYHETVDPQTGKHLYYFD